MVARIQKESEVFLSEQVEQRPATDTKVNILVVDDLPEKLMVYETILEELGQNLMFARSGEEALKLILKHDFAVILLDVNMPNMDGFETASLIRQRKKSASTPIIFLTAFNDDVRVAQGYASGAVDYLQTPVVPEILKAKIKVFIELSQMRLQAASQAEEFARRTAAEEADRRKDEFLGMLAHELRNPLGPIRNAVTLLQLAGATDQKTRQLQQIIERQVTHMARLIDDLLDATRLARGQILLRKEEGCDFSDIVRKTVEDYNTSFLSNDIKLSLDLPDGPMLIDGDPTRLIQAIGNLLHNATKFTNPGDEISVSLKQEKGACVLTVKDTGVGISPEILPHIFDVFRQAEQGLDRNRGGLGLGLRLVKGLIELHDGSVSAHSDGVDKGSRFEIRLPLRKSASSGKSEISQKDFNALQGERVLLIEDNKDTAVSTGMLLSRLGLDVETASSGFEGIRLAKKFNPQFILCDIGLPGMDGYEVAKSIRKDPAFSSVYMIALTGYGRPEDQKHAHAAGFDMHLTKPVDYRVLQQVLANRISGQN